MKNIHIKILMVVFGLMILYPYTAEAKQQTEIPEINIQDDFKDDRTPSLDGKWSYFEGIVTPEEIKYNWEKGKIVHVPIKFSDLHGSNNGTGTFATYIKIPSAKVGKMLAINIPYEYSAYRLYVDGYFESAVGEVGKNRASHRSEVAPSIIYFTPKSSKVFLTMQLSNYDLVRGGFVEKIYIGDAEDVVHASSTEVFWNSFLIGCIMIIGLFTISIGIYKGYGKSILIFGFFCLAIASRALFSVPFVYAKLWPDYPWEWAMKLEYFFTCLATYFFVYLIYSISNGYFKKWIFGVISVVIWSLAAFILVTKPEIFQSVFFTVYTIALPIFLYSAWILCKSVKAKNSLAISNGIGVIIVFIAVIIDFFNGLGWTNLPPLSFFATALYVLIQLIFLSRQFAKEVTGRIRLNGKLQELNSNLDEKIYLRTKELEEANEKLQHVANRDALTGIYNRQYFNEFMANTFVEANTFNTPLSMLMIDADNFKKYNDFYGHIEGDYLLQKLAVIMSDFVPKNGMIARYGGEEFSIVLKDTPKEKAVQLASAIQMFIEKEEISEKEQNYGGITVSIGVATMDEWTSFATVNELIDAADQNLYISKKTGKNKVVF